MNLKRPAVDPDSFSLNNAVDGLWKNEFDQYRGQNIPHPLMIAHQIDAIPYASEFVYLWRDFKNGIRLLNREFGLELCGVIDDIWINPQEELIVVDYKATSKHKQSATQAKNGWQEGNKRQMAFYSYLLKKKGFAIYNKGYFVFSSPIKDKAFFNQQLEFETIIQVCEIDDSWVEETLMDVRTCLDQKEIPEASCDCDFCKYDLMNKG